MLLSSDNQRVPKVMVQLEDSSKLEKAFSGAKMQSLSEQGYMLLQKGRIKKATRSQSSHDQRDNSHS